RCAGRGLGTALLAAAINHLPGARVMTIEVEQRNVRAQRFYEEHG
ncbi:MAG: GNAT family N-acetyltransferase, partial [Hyphomicrobiaceae bacterium]